MKKKKYIAKKKEQLIKFCALIRYFLFSCFKACFFFLPCFMLVFVPVFMTTFIFCLRFFAFLLSYCILVHIFCSKSLVIWLFCYMLAFVSCSESFAILLSGCISVLAIFIAFSLLHHVFISCYRISALLLLLLILSLPFLFRSSFFRIFK